MEQLPWPDDPVADLLEVLDLTLLGEARISVVGAPGDEESDLGEHNPLVFVGRSQYFRGRVFGGQVLAQALVAAGRTVADLPGPARPVHSLHGYFVRGGDDTHPIRFVVERLRDGGSFSVRRVQAVQRGEALLTMTASFQVPAEGLTHQGMMPAAPDPMWLPTIADQLADVDHPSAAYLSRPRAIDIRHIEGNIYLEPGRQRAARQSVWIRCNGPLPDDPLIHAAVLTYASDFNLLEPVLRRHGLAWDDRRLRPASLDHAMWFHRFARADDWVLYAQSSPSATGGRGLAIARMFAQDGRLVSSVAQEGMLRLKPD